MNKNSKLTGLYSALLALFTIAAVTLRTVACLFDLEYSYGAFNSKTLIFASGVTALLGAVVLFSYIIFADRITAVPAFSSPTTYLPTGLVAIALIFLSVSMLSERISLATAPPLLVIICALTALFSVVHFFFNAFIAEARTELRGYFSLATVIFLALYAAYLYFDNTLPVNATNKLTDQLAYLFCALFFLYEARISLGREKWRSYSAFGLVAALLCAYSALPSLIVYFAKGRLISNSIEENILTLTLFIFITARIIMVAGLKEKRDSKEVISMQSYARRREEIITESMNVHKEAFAVQMTIDDLLPEAQHKIDEEEPVLEEPDPEIIEEAPEQITLEMLLPDINDSNSDAEREE